MTRALFVSHTAMKGGAEMFLCELVAAAGGDWRACFLSPGPAAVELAEAGAQVRVLNAGSRLLAVRKGASLGSALAALLSVLKMAHAVAKEAEQVDVLWANSQKALPVCALASLLSRKPLIWGLHDILTDGQFSRVNRLIAIIASRRARIVAANSRASAEAFVAAGGDERQVRVVCNGFASQAARTPTRWLRKRLGVEGKPLIGLFGRISGWKGQHVLIDAIAGQPGIHAIIVGSALFGEEEYEAALRRQCNELGVADRVHFLGFRDDVADLMREMDAVVHCSTIPEPFGRVVAEAMAAGRPVVATEGGGVEELVIDGDTGLLVPPGDAAALGTAVARLLADRKLASRLAKNGQCRVARRYSRAAAQNAARDVIAEAAGCQRRLGGEVVELLPSAHLLRRSA